MKDVSQLAKKAGVAKAKKGVKARSKKAASAEVKQEQDQSLVEATPASEKKQHSFLRLIKPKAQVKVEDKGTAEVADGKKSADKKKAVEQKTKKAPRKESGKPRRVPFQGTVKFFQSAWGELKKVHWPGRREVVVYTTVVISAVVLVAAMIWIADTVLSALIELLLNL